MDQQKQRRTKETMVKLFWINDEINRAPLQPLPHNHLEPASSLNRAVTLTAIVK